MVQLNPGFDLSERYPLRWLLNFACHATSLRYSLPPFPMYRALPRSFEYYGGSVAMRVSPFRRSRIYVQRTFSALRLPVRFLALFIARYSPQRALGHLFALCLHAASPFQGCYGGCSFAPLETVGSSPLLVSPGVQPIQASPYAQDSQVPLRYIPSRFPALPTCFFPLWVSPLSGSVVLKGYSRSPPSVPMGLSVERRNGAPKRTTYLFMLRGAKVEMLTPPKLQIRNGFHPHAGMTGADRRLKVVKM